MNMARRFLVWLRWAVKDLRFYVACLTVVMLFLVLRIEGVANETERVANNQVSSNRYLIDIAESNQVNGALVRDCVTPGGECKKRGERDTAKAVGDISIAALVTAACGPFADGGDTAKARYDRLVKCIEGLRPQVSPPGGNP